MSVTNTYPDMGIPPSFYTDAHLQPKRPISFVVVRFSDEYQHNFARSDCSTDPLNEVILVDNTSNLFFNSLSLAMAQGIAQASHDLVIVIHEDVLLPKGWQGYFEQSLANLEQHDPEWAVLGSVGWIEDTVIFGHWKDPRNNMNSFLENPNSFVKAVRLDEQILIMQKKTLPSLDPELPGIHHIGRGLLEVAHQEGHASYVIDAPTIHKYADKCGNPVIAKEQSEKIMDRETRPYLADRACCNDYIKHRFPHLNIPDYVPYDFGIPFDNDQKLSQLNQPVILLGRGGSGTRLLGMLAKDAGIFTGDNLNRPMDSLDMVMPIYQSVVEKYRCKADWQKSQIVPRLRAAAARLIKDIPADTVWGFKLPESLLLLPELAAAFPEARYVHFIRDPLATCLRRNHLTGRLDNHIGRIAVPLAYTDQGLPITQILSDDPALHMVMTTKHQLELVLSFFSELPTNRQHQIQFEDVIADPAGILTEFCQWLGHESSGELLAKAVDPQRAASGQHEYTESVVEDVRKALTPLRKQLGYIK
jgi:hypothetical protein